MSLRESIGTPRGSLALVILKRTLLRAAFGAGIAIVTWYVIVPLPVIGFLAAYCVVGLAAGVLFGTLTGIEAALAAARGDDPALWDRDLADEVREAHAGRHPEKHHVSS